MSKYVNKTQTNHILYLKNLENIFLVVLQNQRMAGVVIENCTNMHVQFVDSAVITSRTVRIINCTGIYDNNNDYDND